MTLLRIDPASYLLNSGEAPQFFTRRDLLGENAGNIKAVWGLPEVRKLLKGQNSNGSWGKPGGYPLHHKPMVETFKRMRLLVTRYEMSKADQQVEAGCEFLFSTQTLDGDFRGMIGDQYATYYTGEFTGILAKAGYESDQRLELAYRWLLSMRQEDGGWTIPILTLPAGGGIKRTVALTGARAEVVEPDRSKPFSHSWTDMVLRGFAAHPKWRKSQEALHAGELLKKCFFKPDAYASYRNPGYWVRFIHWWPNLLTSLESLRFLGFTASDPVIKEALDWFTENQLDDGSWKTSYKSGDKESIRLSCFERPWVTLRVARLLHAYARGA